MFSFFVWIYVSLKATLSSGCLLSPRISRAICRLPRNKKNKQRRCTGEFRGKISRFAEKDEKSEETKCNFFRQRDIPDIYATWRLDRYISLKPHYFLGMQFDFLGTSNPQKIFRFWAVLKLFDEVFLYSSSLHVTAVSLFILHNKSFFVDFCYFLCRLLCVKLAEIQEFNRFSRACFDGCFHRFMIAFYALTTENLYTCLRTLFRII